MFNNLFSRGWSSPERYIQGPNELYNLKFYTNKIGDNIFFIVDDFLFEDMSESLAKIYQEKSGFIEIISFSGEVTEQVIQEYVTRIKPHNADLIVGIGGGKTIDVAKAVSYLLKLRFIIVPTIASTDAPTSSLSVLYDDAGNHVGEFFYDHNPSIVIVDSTIIANSPTRFLVSGMGDSLATLIEAQAASKSNTRNLVYHKDGGYLQTIAGKTIAKACFDALMENGILAKLSCDKGIVTPYLENIIETNILLSGLGFENNATVGAHSINDGITALPSGEKTMHGEKVAFGCFVQLFAESETLDKIEKLMGFCMKIGLPICLEDLFIENTADNIRKIAQGSMNSNWENMSIDISLESVIAAITLADAYGVSYKENH